MNLARLSIACGALLCAAGTAAHAQLNEFDPADGYGFPFSTPFWTYHSQWAFDGGSQGSNYVAQHGYGSGFAFNSPYGMVVRNDSPGSNFRFSYQFIASDLGGVNPSNVSGQSITIGWDLMGQWNQFSFNANQAPKMAMAFGGTRSSPALTVAISDSNKLMYSDAFNNLIESNAYTIGGGWSRVSLTMDFVNSTYDLSISSMTGNSQNASNTWTIVNTYPVVTGAPMVNSVSSLNTLWWEVFTDPENNEGFSKTFVDHFTSRAVPAPGSTLALAGAGLALSRRRRR